MKYKDIMNRAMNESIAIPAVTVNNLETMKATMEVSKEFNKPIILMVSPSGIKYFGSSLVVKNMFDSIKKAVDANEVFLHLDHSLSVETCYECIDIGFDSIMYDGSLLDFEDNVKNTKKVVEYAKGKNTLVEGEIGKIGGKEDDVESNVVLPSIDEVYRFYKETKVDLLAASVGTVHGDYKSIPKIDFNLISNCKKMNVPLVMHGSSGLSNEIIRKSIELGEAKINVNTTNQKAMIKSLVENININIKDIRDVGRIIIRSYKSSLEKIVKLHYGI